MNIQIQPGYDRFVQSADPEIQAKLIAANKGDLVFVTGVVKNRGSNIRVLTFRTVKPAPTPALTLVPDAIAETETKAVAA